MIYDLLQTARMLAALDSAMRRRHLDDARAVAARVRFVCAATEHFALDHLNRLGELVPDSTLSERSLDVVFEDHVYSGDVVRAIVARCDVDAAFRSALVAQFGEPVLDAWRSSHGDLLSAVA